jgi:hypothetical protein
MRSRNDDCPVLNTQEDSQPCSSEPRDLLPWADPYIARLLDKHRLEAALHDSLDFLRHDPAHEKPQVPDILSKGEGHRPWSD